MDSPINWLLVGEIGLALVFLLHGAAMLSLPEAVQDRMAYMWEIPPRFRTFIGVAEILAAAALLLRTVTGILPWLTPVAAVGLIIVMVGAIVFHIRRGEFRNIVLNLFLLLVLAFVAAGLWPAVPVW
jgi:putative oxidoreductase